MRSLYRTSADDAPHTVLVHGVPVALAVGAYGLSYGVLAVAAGLSPLTATASSALVLAGGSQFAFVGVLVAGGNPFTGALGGLLLNVRYLAFGLAIARYLPPAGFRRRAVDSYLVVDESVGLALAAGGDVARRFRIVGWSVVVAWISATAIGAYGGQLIGDPAVFGLDAAFPAGFLALLAPWLRRRSGRVAALVGVALALALTPFTPAGVPIIAAAAGALVALRVTELGVAADGAASDREAADPGRADRDGAGCGTPVHEAADRGTADRDGARHDEPAHDTRRLG